MILTGTRLAQYMNTQTRNIIASNISKIGKPPSIKLFVTYNDERVENYISKLILSCDLLGIETEIIDSTHEIDLETLCGIIKKEGDRTDTSGLFVSVKYITLTEAQNPINPIFRESVDILHSSICPEKDIDCANPVNYSRIFCNVLDHSMDFEDIVIVSF